MKNVTRCKWCNLKNPLYVEYHDREWGVPRFDDACLFEMLFLESFQAGLSWECVLNKRENFRIVFDGFDAHKIALYDESKIESLMSTSGIIRNRRKICAAVKNSRVFLAIVEEYGSFYDYLKTFAGEGTIYETGRTASTVSDAISKDLRKRGMGFVGSVIIYSYLQAIGIISSHEEGCFLHQVQQKGERE